MTKSLEVPSKCAYHYNSTPKEEKERKNDAFFIALRLFEEKTSGGKKKCFRLEKKERKKEKENRDWREESFWEWKYFESTGDE